MAKHMTKKSRETGFLNDDNNAAQSALTVQELPVRNLVVVFLTLCTSASCEASFQN
jgi:hypothetical protein